MILPSDPLLILINIAEWVGIASLKTIPLIVFVLILQRFFRKQLSATSRYLLWLSVLLSLSIPVGWTLDIDSSFNSTFRNTNNKLENVTLQINSANLNNSELFINNEQDAVATNSIAAHDVSAIKSNNLFSTNIWTVVIEHYRLGLTIFWLCGVLVFFVLTLTKARYFHRIKTNATHASPDLISLFNSCKQELGISQPIQLLSTSEIQSPITLGCIHPAVIVPQNIEQQLTPAKLKYVLLHELGHIKRQDIFFNWLACLINILHWFNPAIWFACKRMRMDMEIACDALVLSHLDKSQRKSYGATLIEISEIPRVSPKALTTLGILENHTELKERLNMIKDFTTMNMKNTLIFGLVLVTITFTALAQPAAQKLQPAIAEASTTKSAVASGTSLREVAARAEKDLKTKVLVGQKDAENHIQVNFGADVIDYGQLLTQLKINEYTAYKSKDYIQIIPINDARFLAIPTVEKGKTHYEDEVVTDYLVPEKACAGKVLAALRPLVPQYAHLTTFDDNNTLIISDTYGNIQRIKSAIKAIDANLRAPQNCKAIAQQDASQKK